MSPRHDAPHTKKHEPNLHPLPVVDKDTADVQKKQPGNSEQDYASNIKTIGEFLRNNPPTPQGFFNLVVAIFAAATCWVTYLQYTAQLVDQRAWVGVALPVTDLAVPEVGKGFAVVVNFINSGKTPALNVVYRKFAEQLPKKKLPDFRHTKYIVISGGLITPNGYTNTGLPLPMNSDLKAISLTREMVEGLKDESQRTYVYGRVSYRDIFEKCHWLDFCFYPIFTNATSFAFCEEDHNDTGDEECIDN